MKKNPEKQRHVTKDYVDIYKYFLAFHKYMTLVADIMFVNSITFLITTSCGIKYVTVKHIPSHMAKKLKKI